jgi:hypothetical protein
MARAFSLQIRIRYGMDCQIREDLRRAKESVDAMAYVVKLGSQEFDHWLAESADLQKALDTHKEICPVCHTAHH